MYTRLKLQLKDPDKETRGGRSQAQGGGILLRPSPDHDKKKLVALIFSEVVDLHFAIDLLHDDPAFANVYYESGTGSDLVVAEEHVKLFLDRGVNCDPLPMVDSSSVSQDVLNEHKRRHGM